MSKAIKLNAELRADSGKRNSRRLRRDGNIPGVIYGRGIENLNVQVNQKALEGILSHSAGGNILVRVEVEGQAPRLALIQEVQYDSFGSKVNHIDLHAVNENEKIHAQVPLVLVGEASGVKQGGLLEQLVHQVAVNCSPATLPDVLELDVSAVEIGQTLHLREIPLPEGVELQADGEIPVALVVAPRVAADGASA